MSLSLRILISLNKYKMYVFVVCISLRFENIVMNGLDGTCELSFSWIFMAVTGQNLRNQSVGG